MSTYLEYARIILHQARESCTKLRFCAGRTHAAKRRNE